LACPEDTLDAPGTPASDPYERGQNMLWIALNSVAPIASLACISQQPHHLAASQAHTQFAYYKGTTDRAITYRNAQNLFVSLAVTVKPATIKNGFSGPKAQDKWQSPGRRYQRKTLCFEPRQL
jgi:hypothetical protein